MAEIHYHVDHESQTTESEELTAREILRHANIDPEQYYLVELRGEERISFKDNPDQKIKLHDGMHFLSVSFGRIHYFVDDERQETDEEELTATEILDHAKIDPKNHYLVQIKGKERISYKDDPNKEIRMRNGMKFISVSTGPTPVSD
jgi:hypothetical protein